MKVLRALGKHLEVRGQIVVKGILMEMLLADVWHQAVEGSSWEGFASDRACSNAYLSRKIEPERESEHGFAAEVQQKCSRSAAEVQQKCSRSAAGVQQECSRSAEVQQQGSKGVQKASKGVQKDNIEPERESERD
jgi:hypothetical protein